VDVAVYEIIRRAVRGDLVGGQTISLGLAEGGVGYVYDAANHPLVSDDVHARVEQLRQALVAGVIRPRAARS
jgi:basic membrane protein A